MGFFPVFLNLSKKRVLVIGGGSVATRKVKSLLLFTKNVTVVAPKVKPELMKVIEENRLRLRRRRFKVSDLKGKDLVVVAVDDTRLQEKVFRLCEQRGILCNSVDSPEYCNFLFPSLIVRGDLVVGICTGGKAPALSKRLREVLERAIPENVEEVLRIVSEKRARLPKGSRRREVMRELVRRLVPDDRGG